MTHSKERIFTFADVKRLYTQKQKVLARAAFLGAALALLLNSFREPQYEITGIFKEAIDPAEGENRLKGLLNGVGIAVQPEVPIFMKSDRVLKPLVQTLGLQFVVPKDRSFIRCLKENIRAELTQSIEDPHPFVVRDLRYEGEEKLRFYLKFSDSEHYAIYSSDRKKELGTGVVGVRAQFQTIEWTIQSVPKEKVKKRWICVTLIPWMKAVAALRKDLKMTSDSGSHSIHHLSFRCRDRHFGKTLINEWMRQYQHYLKNEHDQIAQEQLLYLETKQAQIYNQMSSLLDEQTHYLKENWEKGGFVGLEEGTESFLLPYQKMEAQKIQVNLELSQIDQILSDGKCTSYGGESGLSQKMEGMLRELQDLKHQKDLLELSLCQQLDLPLDQKKEELKQVRHRKDSIQQLMYEVGKEISSLRLHAPAEEQQALTSYLENYTHLLSVREKMVQEQFFCGGEIPNELEGIELSTAQHLFAQYNHQLDTAYAAMRKFSELQEQIQHADFELSSLSSLLADPLSQKLILDASSLELRLKDQKSHSEKESKRWEEELILQKTILGAHLNQMHKVEQVQASLIREKMGTIQKISLDCISRKISVLQEEMQDTLKGHRQALLIEKGALEKQMKEVCAQWAFLPEKWRLEKWLDLKATIGSKLIEKITEVVESKTISHHLHRVGSKPLDWAALPLEPLKPRLILMTVLCSFACAATAFIGAFVTQAAKGFPLSFERLQKYQIPVLGKISRFCDEPSVETLNRSDLEVLRNLNSFSQNGKVVGVLMGFGPDYSFAWAQLKSFVSIRAIVLRCDFLSSYRQEEVPGLLQIWEGKMVDLPIRKGKGFDYMTTGGLTPYGAEILQSERFKQLIFQLKEKYDQVLIVLRAPLTSAESQAALQICDQAVVTATKEQIEELTPFINWAYDGSRCRLTFLTEL